MEAAFALQFEAAVVTAAEAVWKPFVSSAGTAVCASLPLTQAAYEAAPLLPPEGSVRGPCLLGSMAFLTDDFDWQGEWGMWTHRRVHQRACIHMHACMHTGVHWVAAQGKQGCAGVPACSAAWPSLALTGMVS